jgi:hypothetical protein
MKKSYHSIAVPTKLPATARRTVFWCGLRWGVTVVAIR